MSITGANSSYTLSISAIFDQPQQLQGYAVDDAFTTQALKSAETLMGVDGFLSGGFVYVPVEQEIMLQANSPSVAIFDQWTQLQVNAVEIFVASGVIQLPSVGIAFTMTKGFLTSYSIIPDVKRLLQPRRFGITWERCVPQPL